MHICFASRLCQAGGVIAMHRDRGDDAGSAFPRPLMACVKPVGRLPCHELGNCLATSALEMSITAAVGSHSFDWCLAPDGLM